jgi:tetratricopeptide (TPR) repeat protein
MRTVFWKSMYLGKKIFMWCMYLIFAGYICFLIIQTPRMGAKLMFGLTGVIILGIILLFEYLKNLYEKMIYALTVECDVQKAVKLKEQLQQKDLFNGFKQSIIIFDSLLLLDTGSYTDCLQHLAQNQFFFRSTLDYLFIYYHTQLYCFFFLNQPEKILSVVRELAQLKHVKKKQLSQLFSWHEIDGIAYFAQNRLKKCLKELEQVDRTRLNNRELAYQLYLQGQCFLRLNETATGNRLLKEAKSIGKKTDQFTSIKSGGN